MPDNHNLLLPMFSPMAQAPTKRYRTIVADPPWRIEMAPAIKPQFGGRVKSALAFPTMTVEEVANLPVGLWAMDRAHLYLWCTNSTVPHAYRIATDWGFKPSTLLTWIKRKPTNDGWMGLGRYFRITTEHALFAVRGGLDVHHKDQPNFFYAPRGGHSEKPSRFYDIAEHMSPGPYLDVFARKQRMGWDCFGNEAYNPAELLDTLTEEQADGLVAG